MWEKASSIPVCRASARCEANSQPQIRAIADSIETEVKKKCEENPYHYEGKQNLQWVLIDYVNVVVHNDTRNKKIL